MAFLTPSKLESLGFRELGKNVLISEKASIYGAQYISIGDNVRVDDFCILSAGAAGFRIGCYVHISCYASLVGQGEIIIGDYSNVSGRTSVYSSSDDFSGATMIGPLVDSIYTNVLHAPVRIGRHVIIGAGTVVLPGVTISEGVAIGAMSLINSDCAAFGVYIGVPAKFRKHRKRNFLDMELRFQEDRNNIKAH